MYSSNQIFNKNVGYFWQEGYFLNVWEILELAERPLNHNLHSVLHTISRMVEKLSRGLSDKPPFPLPPPPHAEPSGKPLNYSL